MNFLEKLFPKPRLVPAGGPEHELTMEVRIYRERPGSARHPKPAALEIWDFLAAQSVRR